MASYFVLFQLLYTAFSATALTRVLGTKPFATWMSTFEFYYYVVPTDQDLLAAKRGGSSGGSSPGETSGGKKAKKRNVKQQRGSPQGPNFSAPPFKIPASSLDSLKLNKSLMRPIDFEMLPNSSDLEWMVDMSTMTFFNFYFTDLLFYFIDPQKETANLSQIWLAIVILSCALNFWRMAKTYFNGQNNGEASICIVSFFIFLLIAVVVLAAKEDTLEFGLGTAYSAYHESATAFLKHQQSIQTPGASVASRPEMIVRPISFVSIKICLAIVCALTGMCFTFPAFRVAQLHKIILEDREKSVQLRMMSMFTFMGPLVITLLWVKPMTRDLFTSPILFDADDETFDACRLMYVVFVYFLKFSALPHFVNAYLSSVLNRMKRLKRRGGQILNKEIQEAVSGIYYYINVVLIQYMAPILLCLSLAFFYKTWGKLDWMPPAWHHSNLEVKYVFPKPKQSSMPGWFASAAQQPLPLNAPPLNATTEFTSMDEISGIFMAKIGHAVIGFIIWWTNMAWFVTTSAGMVFHTYFYY